MIRGVTFIIAVFGYIIASTLGYFAIYPLKIGPRKSLSLDEMFSCTTTSARYTYEDLTNQKQEEIKNSIGPKLPITQIKNLLANINGTASYVGMQSSIRIDFCDIQGSENEILKKVTDYLKNYGKYYEYGALNEFVARINDLPFAQVSNFEMNINSAFARTTYCNVSIVESKLHLFLTLDPGISSYKRVVLFTVELLPIENPKIERKVLRNLIETGNFFKTRLNCDGR